MVENYIGRKKYHQVPLEGVAKSLLSKRKRRDNKYVPLASVMSKEVIKGDQFMPYQDLLSQSLQCVPMLHRGGGGACRVSERAESPHGGYGSRGCP